VGENDRREARFILQTQQENSGNGGHEFMVQSRLSQAGESGKTRGNWENHVVGKINNLKNEDTNEETGAQPVEIRHNPEEIAALCNQKDIAVTKTPESGSTAHAGLLTFGPRWRNVDRLLLAQDRGMAYLSVGDSFANELELLKLHPALLDSATGFLFRHVGEKPYIPFAYKQLRMKKPMTPEIISYARVVEDTEEGGGQETLKFDITIMDRNGVELVDIKEFTMLEVSDEVKGKIEQKSKEPETMASDALSAVSTLGSLPGTGAVEDE
ncbi:MAG: hypothetical protein GY940_18615, partial [bacterium]|nr:hypothetical protein [bacterium]